jgi:hypothetical protein
MGSVRLFHARLALLFRLLILDRTRAEQSATGSRGKKAFRATTTEQFLVRARFTTFNRIAVRSFLFRVEAKTFTEKQRMGMNQARKATNHNRKAKEERK